MGVKDREQGGRRHMQWRIGSQKQDRVGVDEERTREVSSTTGAEKLTVDLQLESSTQPFVCKVHQLVSVFVSLFNILLREGEHALCRNGLELKGKSPSEHLRTEMTPRYERLRLHNSGN